MTIASVEPAIKGYASNGDIADGTDPGSDAFYSSLQRERLNYVPPKPAVLQGMHQSRLILLVFLEGCLAKTTSRVQSSWRLGCVGNARGFDSLIVPVS